MAETNTLGDRSRDRFGRWFASPASVLVILPLLADSSVRVFGMPLLLVWIFLLFPLTSLCLWIAWRIDEPHYRAAPRPTAEE